MPWALSWRLCAILAILLSASVAFNVMQLRNNAKAKEACSRRIAELEATALHEAAARDTEALVVARRHDEQVSKLINEIEALTNDRITRVRTITRTMPVPAECALPDSVYETLSEAAAAANSRLRATGQ